MAHYDVIVVGASGGAGSAAAYHLSRRGARVLGLDRSPPGHDLGSSHGKTRVIRMAYFEHPDYVPLLRRAYQLWNELESESGKNLLHQTGLVEIGAPDGEVVPGVLASAFIHKLAVEQMAGADAMRRFPGLRVPEGLDVVYEPSGGFLDVEDCVIAHAQGAERVGATLRTGEEVTGWRATSGAVEVTTDRGTYAADKLVLAPGAWASTLLADLGVRFTTVRKTMWWFDAPRPEHHAENGCPVFLYELPEEGVFYGTPAVGGSGIKVAEHTGGRLVPAPRGDDRHEDREERARVESFAQSYLPGVGTRLLTHAVCFYPMSPDDHFLIGAHPEHARVVFAAGLSGHGFKFTSALGEVLADLALDGRARVPIDFLSWNRPALHS
ncbi:MAG TPA: N-methyl-L-tryptophan oxidase [Candidatus Eisenbacteria bacterium]|nr:N-methyl-L-tryptophan oxidase [Candidatus Eisenbacteria bacterium]